MTLYVNGKPAGSVNNRSAWDGNGALTIGANHNANGTWDNKTVGSIAAVQTYPYTLTADQVTSLYTNQ